MKMIYENYASPIESSARTASSAEPHWLGQNFFDKLLLTHVQVHSHSLTHVDSTNSFNSLVELLKLYTMVKTAANKPPQGQNSAPTVRDVLSQIAHHLQETGYTKTLRALEKEGKGHGVDVDATAWGSLASGGKHNPTTLTEFWLAISDGLPPSLDQPSKVDEDDSSSESEDEENEEGGAALVDDEAEETSNDSSDEDSEDESASAGKAGQKRKRQLTPDSSSSDSSSASSIPMSDVNAKQKDASDSSDSDSDSDSSSSDSDRRPVKRTKISSKKSDSSSDSESSSSDSGVYSTRFLLIEFSAYANGPSTV